MFILLMLFVVDNDSSVHGVNSRYKNHLHGSVTVIYKSVDCTFSYMTCIFMLQYEAYTENAFLW
jgi:hypothetical protein